MPRPRTEGVQKEPCVYRVVCGLDRGGSSHIRDRPWTGSEDPLNGVDALCPTAKRLRFDLVPRLCCRRGGSARADFLQSQIDLSLDRLLAYRGEVRMDWAGGQSPFESLGKRREQDGSLVGCPVVRRFPLISALPGALGRESR